MGRGNRKEFGLPVTGGTLTGDLKLNDDVDLDLGTGTDYSLHYDSSNTRLELVSTDTDGAGADGDVLRVDDGTDDVEFVGNIGVGITPTTTNNILVPQSNDAVTPTIGFGDADSGFYESADDTLNIATAGAVRWAIGGNFVANNTLGAGMGTGSSSATVPTIWPRRVNTDTGLGSGQDGQLSLICESTEMGRFTVGGFSTPATLLTLGVGVTTFSITSNVMTITGDSGGNTLATITGGSTGMLLTLIFVDALVTITDDNTHASNSMDLSAAFVSADDTVLQLVHNGTSWYEVSRSTN